jgi:hypothetical protein
MEKRSRGFGRDSDSVSFLLQASTAMTPHTLHFVDELQLETDSTKKQNSSSVGFYLSPLDLPD